MKNTAFALICLSIGTFMNAATAQTAARAEALVRAMRSDELAVSSARRAFANGAIKDYENANAGCLKRVDYKDFTQRFSQVVAQVLTAPEIDTALAFYQSPAGVKYVEGTIRRLRTSFGDDSGLPKVPAVEDISQEERDKISAFASSDLGRKISGKQMTESPAALKFGRDMIDEIGQKCSKSRK